MSKNNIEHGGNPMESNFVFLCAKQETKNPTQPYNHFYKNAIQLKMSGVPLERMTKVLVRETEETEGTYWGFKDLEKNTISHIKRTKSQLEICSPDAFTSRLEKELGMIVRLKIIELPS